MPSGLKSMLQDMDNIVDCTAFVPAYLKHALSQLERGDPYYKAPGDHMYEDGDALAPEPIRGCHTPEAFVYHPRSIVELSGECQNSFQVESGWNLLVHTPVLAAGLYLGPLRKDLVCLLTPRPHGLRVYPIPQFAPAAHNEQGQKHFEF
ncbi:hypothetical protein FJTKL_07388 [Diaporthe vaccinii]|uniref:Uncharacterized protein n=1 Tax=Diaporthe vaccinii TaxID=105482 RepID=A0ABR4ETX7_9PEZI